MRSLFTLACLALTLPLLHAQQQQPATNNTNPNSANSNSANPNNASYVLKVQSDLVLTNVVVRDKRTGAAVKGLTARSEERRVGKEC